MRRLVAVAAVSALVAGCGGSSLHRAGGPVPTHPADETAGSSVAVSPSLSPVAHAGPAVQRFAATAGVPWSSIGPGWFLVSVDSPASHLVLVDPDGRHYPLHTPAGRWSVVGWSGDAQRLLLQADGDGFPKPTYVVDLRTGRQWRPVLPAGVGVVGFTRPRGLGLLTAVVSKQEDGSYAHYRIERRSLDGTDPVVVAGDLVPDTNVQHMVYTPDGAHLVLVDHNRLTLVSNATGHVVRALARPAECNQPIRMWDATHVLAGCSSLLALVPLDGGRWAPLVQTGSERGPDYADIDAFRTSDGGLYTDSLGACGSEFVGKVRPDGHVDPANVPNTTQNTKPLAVRGDTVAVAAVLGCEGPKGVPSLFWWDPKSGHEQVIWAPRRGDHDPEFIPFQSDFAASLQAWLG